MRISPQEQDDVPGGQYAGTSTCRECHESFYQLWAPSHHGLAMQPYSAAFAADNLTTHDGEVEVGGRSYRAETAPEEGWVVERTPEGEVRYEIVHVLGGKNVFYFLTPFERGRLQVLPLAYDVVREEWFDTAQSGMRHFADRPEQPVHWTERPYTFNSSCHSCHVSQLSTNYDFDNDSYSTTWAEPGINCETCHGPGDQHVRICRSAPAGQVPADLAIIRTGDFTPQQRNDMCAPCHAKMSPVTASFLPGERYFDHYDLTTLEHPDFYPDGRDLGENYTLTGWRMSSCAKAGQLDCLHCHTSSGRYRHLDDPNQSCLPCHQSRVDEVVEHSRHPAGFPGSHCIDCHMPVTEFARMRRSDHSMLPPTPATTLSFESPNACNLCHGDENAAWANALVREWHGDAYQDRVLHRAGLVAAARQEDWSRLREMLAYLKNPGRDEVTANSLVRLLSLCPDERAWAAITELLGSDSSPLLRASAAGVLGVYLTNDTVEALLEATGDDFRLVRVRAASSLAPLPPSRLAESPRRRLEAALEEFFAAMSARPDDALSHYNLGNFQMGRGALDLALECFETSARLDPTSIPPLVNAALVFARQGRMTAAEAKLRSALEQDAEDATANFNLGLLLAEQGKKTEAEAAFRRALKRDPRMAPAAYNLGVLLTESRLEEGVEWCRRAAELVPNDPKYAYTLAFYQHQLGDSASAIATLERMLDAKMPLTSAYLLLGDIHESAGRTDDALSVYRRAVQNEGLSERDRFVFAERIRRLSSK